MPIEAQNINFFHQRSTATSIMMLLIFVFWEGFPRTSMQTDLAINCGYSHKEELCCNVSQKTVVCLAFPVSVSLYTGRKLCHHYYVWGCHSTQWREAIRILLKIYICFLRSCCVGVCKLPFLFGSGHAKSPTNSRGNFSFKWGTVLMKKNINSVGLSKAYTKMCD